jgi:hypothetical protein
VVLVFLKNLLKQWTEIIAIILIILPNFSPITTEAPFAVWQFAQAKA